MTPEQLEQARKILGLTQAELGHALGWTGPKQVQNLELGHRPITTQTALAVECLLRRAGKRPQVSRLIDSDSKGKEMYDEIWVKANNNGEGFGVDGDDINALEGFGDLIKKAHSDDDVAVYKDLDTITIVADANGLWAVQVKG